MLYNCIVIYKYLKGSLVEKLVQLSKIMSDLNRVKILTLILRDKEVCVCEICDTLELSQPLVSRHLRQMKEAGILEVKKRGKWMIYTLSHEPDSILKCWINELQIEINSLPRLVQCGSLK